MSLALTDRIRTIRPSRTRNQHPLTTANSPSLSLGQPPLDPRRLSSLQQRSQTQRSFLSLSTPSYLLHEAYRPRQWSLSTRFNFIKHGSPTKCPFSILHRRRRKCIHVPFQTFAESRCHKKEFGNVLFGIDA